DVAAERFERLRLVVERSALRQHEGRVGRMEEALVEGPSKRDPSVLTGRTRQNKLVHFPAHEQLPAGTFVDVLVTGAAPHHLTGEPVSVTGRPRRRARARIPVVAV